MKETSLVPEDIIIRRVQRRIERYISDLEKSKIQSNKSNQSDAKLTFSEGGDTKIATTSLPEKSAEKKIAFETGPITQTNPPPPLPIPTVSSTKQKTQPKEAVQPQSFPPILEVQSHKEIISDGLETSENTGPDDLELNKENSSFLPIFVFFLALVAALGVFLGWYLFSGGSINFLAP